MTIQCEGGVIIPYKGPCPKCGARSNERCPVGAAKDAELLERLTFVMGEVARGRCDNGRPLAAETSRQMARDVMARFGLRWPEHKKKPAI